MNSDNAGLRRSPLARFLAFIRPHLRLVTGAALMGVGKFTLPLIAPLATRYVIDVLLRAAPKIDHIDLLIDHWCAWAAGALGAAHLVGASASSANKLAALSIAMLLLYAMQSAAVTIAITGRGRPEIGLSWSFNAGSSRISRRSRILSSIATLPEQSSRAC